MHWGGLVYHCKQRKYRNFLATCTSFLTMRGAWFGRKDLKILNSNSSSTPALCWVRITMLIPTHLVDMGLSRSYRDQSIPLMVVTH